MTSTPTETAARQVKKTLRLVAPCLLVVSSATFLSSCASSDLPLVSVSEANAGLAQGYQIGGGDKVRVTVFDEPALTGDFDISLDGNLALPLIGTIVAEGKSAKELSDAIASALSEGQFVTSPKVAVDVAQHRPFFILGEVKEPGEYPYIGDLTVEQAIAKAGGYTPRAAKSEVVLRRQTWPQGKRVKLGTTPLLIAPGDTIQVEEAFF